MKDYRVYILADDGHVESRVDLQCDSEAEAIKLASQYVGGHDLDCGNWIERSRRSGTRPISTEPITLGAAH